MEEYCFVEYVLVSAVVFHITDTVIKITKLNISEQRCCLAAGGRNSTEINWLTCKDSKKNTHTIELKHLFVYIIKLLFFTFVQVIQAAVPCD